MCSLVLFRSHSLHRLLWRWCSQMLDPLHSLHRLLIRWCSQMLDPLHSLHRLLWRWCSQKPDPPNSLLWFLRRVRAHMLAISFGIFLLSCGRSPTADSSTCASMRGDSRYLACIKPPGKVGSDGFNFCRVFCTGLPQLLTSWALVCSLRGLFIAASLLSDPARFRVDTVPWLCALSPLNTSIGIVWRSLYSVLLLASCSKLRIAYEKATPRPLVCV